MNLCYNYMIFIIYTATIFYDRTVNCSRETTPANRVCLSVWRSCANNSEIYVAHAFLYIIDVFFINAR